MILSSFDLCFSQYSNVPIFQRSIRRMSVLLGQDFGPCRHGPLLPEQLLHRRFGLHPEGLGVRDHHLHALALEIHQDGLLAGLDLIVGPVLRLLGGLDDEVLVRLGQLVEEGLVDQDSPGLHKVIGDDQMALDLVQLEGGDLWQVALRGFGLARLQRIVELGQR